MRTFTFTKGPAVDNQTGTTNTAADANFTGISLVWTPNLATEQFKETPTIDIYPNPSTTGVFNLDLKNDVDSIKVIDILGKVVYNQKLTGDATGTTRTIDLSAMVNGIYFVNVTNDKGSSNYKVVLNK